MKNNQVKILANIHTFIHQSEGLKRLLRHSWLSDGRKESVAEHTWRMALMALVLYRELEVEIDIAKVIKMILIHDLAEIVVGDYWALGDIPKDKHEQELKGLQELTGDLPLETRKEFIDLWEEFEEGKTNEAKFGIALDKLEVLIQHNEAGVETWNEKEFAWNYTYAYDKVQWSKVLTMFRDLVLEETVEKINREPTKKL